MWPLFSLKRKAETEILPLSDIRKSRKAQPEILMRMGLVTAAAQKY